MKCPECGHEWRRTNPGLSAAIKALWADPEWSTVIRAKMSEGQKRRMRTPKELARFAEARANGRLAQKENARQRRIAKARALLEAEGVLPIEAAP